MYKASSLVTKINCTDTNLVSKVNNLDKINCQNETGNKVFYQNNYLDEYKKKSFEEIIKEIPYHSER